MCIRDRFIIILIPAFSSCGLLYRVILGVDTTPTWQTKRQIEKQSKKYDIPTQYSLIQDTALYYHFVDSVYKDTLDAIEISENDSSTYYLHRNIYKDDAQPTQFRLYDSNGMGLFKIVNCYVDPPIPMDWNVDGCFNSFPPTIDIKSLNHHYFDLDLLLHTSKTMEGNTLQMADLPKADYYGVIVWNKFFKRPSKKLIQTIREYAENSEASIQLIYINNHNAFMWDMMDKEMRAEAKEKLSNY